jgi:hypothetical protein
MDGSRVVRVEVDEDGDGNVDRWEYHQSNSSIDQVPTGPDRSIERVERATRFDGIVSRREYFKDGVIARVEEDTDGDGRVDKWETYKQGVLSTIELDSTGRGTPDRRLVYAADGSFDHIEADANGSGVFRTVSP